MSIRIGNKIVASNTATNLATTEEAGIIRIATDEEVKAGLANNLAITPHQLANAASKTSVDEETIVKDEDDVITAVGVRTRNDVLMYNWMGTSEEYQKDQELGIIQPDWVCYITDDDEDYDSLTPTYGSDVALLDIIVSNQVLEGVDLIGKALQGSLIIASEYPDAYAKLVENKNKIGSTSVTETIGGIEVTYIQCKNGYKIIDIANKDKYDAVFEATATANFFVLDEGSKVFYLPKTNNFLQPNLNGLGNYNEAGLPNIEGTVSDFNMASDYDGAFYNKESKEPGYVATGNSSDASLVSFDASRSNPIYGNADTVQPASTNVYIYYKVGNTVQADNIIELEAQVANLSARNNIPFTLFECKYSQFKISNLSWLLSEGQWNDGKRYVGAYNKLNELYQVPVEGLTVKLHNEEYTDYDFVINVEDETFRLPLKVKLAGGKAVVGNGITLGLTNGTQNIGLGKSPSLGFLGTPNYGDNIGSTYDIGFGDNDVSYGITTDPTKSGIETSDSDLYLYFYIGETLQGLNDINLSEVGDLLRMIQDLQARVLELETNINAGGAQQE